MITVTGYTAFGNAAGSTAPCQAIDGPDADTTTGADLGRYEFNRTTCTFFGG